MSPFLNSLKDRLTAIEQEMQSLPGELDSALTRLDRAKLRSLFTRLNQDFNKLFDAHHRSGMFSLPLIIEPTYPYIREITSEDWSRWREAYKSDVRVVIGKGKVEIIAVADLTREYKATVSQVVLIAQQQGYIVLGWDQHQKLLAEISKLIGGDEESLPGTIVGIPVTTTDSTQGIKMLPQSPHKPSDTP
jgi:hypothetical protein